MQYTKEELEQKPRLLFNKKRDQSGSKKARPGSALDSISTKKRLQKDRLQSSADDMAGAEEVAINTKTVIVNKEGTKKKGIKVSLRAKANQS